jgi:hypothetical protein
MRLTKLLLLLPGCRLQDRPVWFCDSVRGGAGAAAGWCY